MRVVVLGTGDLTKIPRFTGMSQENLVGLVSALGKLIADEKYELVIIPDRGVPVEVAKVYRENNGVKVYGVVPVKDTKFGTRHIQPYLSLIDEKIEVDHWYDADGEIASSGDVCVVLGMSPGVLREVSVLKYHYRYLGSTTRLVWFKNTLSAPIPGEVAEEIPVTYVESVDELLRFLRGVKPRT